MRETLAAIRPYVPGKPIDEVRRELGIKGEIVKLASNENPLGPSPQAIQAMRKAAEEVFLYPDGNSFSLRSAIAELHGVALASVVCGNGSDEVIELVGKTYVGPGSEVVFASPTFSEYEFATRIMGGQCVVVPVRPDHSHDLSAMAAAITPATAAVFVCNPNNPTGTIARRGEIDAFMAAVPESVLVVFDEAYVEFVDDPDYVSGLEYLAKGRNVLVLRTFSKVHGLAGLRVGYGIANPNTVAELMRVREPFNVNLMAQAAALAALGATDHVARTVALTHAGRAQFSAAFADMGLEYIPTQANFVMVNVRTDCKPIFQALMAKGYIVRTCDIFGMPTWLRVTFGTEAQNAGFLRALAEVLG